MQLNALATSLTHFLAELQRRKVLRLASAYVVGGWIVLQVSVTLQTAMKLPDSFSTIIVALLLIGFPIALTASWFFEITPEGIRRTAPASGTPPPFKPQTTDLILAAALVLVLAVAIVQLITPRDSAPATTSTAEATKPKPEAPALGDKSIAVLPFANMSPDKDDAYFADGLTEQVLNVLAQVRGLRLISRTSSFAFKGKDTPLPEIAKQLGVRHILEGSVRRDGEDIRITAQLIDVTSDTHLWSETFERKTENVFSVQEQIARAIANALDVEIAVSAFSPGAPSTNMEAYRLLLEAQELFRLRRTLDDLSGSVALYKRAIALDPKFAEAYAGLALSYSSIWITSPAERQRFEPLGRTAAETAIKLKPSLAQPHAVLAGIARISLDWETASAHTIKAISLDPSDSLSLYSLGFGQLVGGNTTEALRNLYQAQRTDPLYAFLQTGTLAAAFAHGDDTACLDIANKLARSGAIFGRSGLLYLMHHARTNNNPKEAEKRYREWAKLGGLIPLEPVVAALKSPKALPAAVSAINEARIKSPRMQLLLLLMIGAQDDFLDALNAEVLHGNKALVLGGIGYAWRSVATGGAPPKFKTLMRNAGLVAYWKKHGWPDRCRAKGEDDFECS